MPKRASRRSSFQESFTTAGAKHVHPRTIGELISSHGLDNRNEARLVEQPRYFTARVPKPRI